ncbi:MAG: hypothetical protein PHF86_09160 [Candidatus Nanoarchaeia archaeon]|nr:hypothetical protein [Candidatus Nanoarchaeia archaeon]
MNKKGSELTLNTIIVTILILLVFILLVLFFTGNATKILSKFDNIISSLVG